MITLVFLIIPLAFVFFLRADEVYDFVFLSVSIENCTCLQIVDCNHPFVSLLRRITAEVDVTLRFLIFSFVQVHSDADHEARTLVSDLLRSDDIVDEWQLDTAHIVVCYNLILDVVEPF